MRVFFKLKDLVERIQGEIAPIFSIFTNPWCADSLIRSGALLSVQSLDDAGG